MAASIAPRAAEASAVTLPEASIVVRTYTQPDSEAHMPGARRTASAALEHAGIEVFWVECGGRASAPPAANCGQPLRWNEVVVRIVSAGAADRRDHVDSLGFAFVDLDAGGGWLATVYADRVGEMAALCRVDAAELLGSAIAHEIGHLLLGTHEHAPHGLMRAAWSGADLRRARVTQWRFGGKESEAMRRRLASRFRS